MRLAARMAARIKGLLDGVHVTEDDGTTRRDQQSLAKLRELADNLGARWYEIRDDNPAMAIASFAREHQITQIVIGSSRRSWWQHLSGHGSNARRVLREAGAVGIDVHVIARSQLPMTAAAEAGARTES